MNKELQAAIIRKHGAPFHFPAAMGIRENDGAWCRPGEAHSGPDTRRNWADVLDVPGQRLFPLEGNGDD
jgi:hypothetical protein